MEERRLVWCFSVSVSVVAAPCWLQWVEQVLCVVITDQVLLTCSLPEASACSSAPAALVLRPALHGVEDEAAERASRGHGGSRLKIGRVHAVGRGGTEASQDMGSHGSRSAVVDQQASPASGPNRGLARSPHVQHFAALANGRISRQEPVERGEGEGRSTCLT